jgi:uncharacterized protein (TIGR03118 family)
MFRTRRKTPTFSQSRLSLEALEDRSLLSGTVLQINLVSDLPGLAWITDPNLVNPWGISEGPSSPFWISDNKSGMSTLYNTPGKPQSLAVGIPTPGNPTGANTTGTVYNIAAANLGFMVSDGIHDAPATFLFATQNGTIAGWNPWVDPTEKFDGPGGASTHAVIPVDNSTSPSAGAGAVYKGLAIATDGNGRTLLYAANFRSGQIDVFNTSFKPVTDLPLGAFTDSNLPQSFAPFNVQTLGNQIYVTYAKQDGVRYKNVAGTGNGFIDVFNLDGSGGHRLVSGGPLDSPWGLAFAPASFGAFAGKLLVGNFGSGYIDVIDPGSGAFLGELKDLNGNPVQIDGLWALQVGNGKTGGNANKVYFTAGLDHEQHGLFGELAGVADGPADGLAAPAAPQAPPAQSQSRLEPSSSTTNYTSGQSSPTSDGNDDASQTVANPPLQGPYQPPSQAVYQGTVINVASSANQAATSGPAAASNPPEDAYAPSQADTSLDGDAPASGTVIMGPVQQALPAIPPASDYAGGLYIRQSYLSSDSTSYASSHWNYGTTSYQEPQAPAAEAVVYEETPKGKLDAPVEVPTLPGRQPVNPPVVLAAAATIPGGVMDTPARLESGHSNAGPVTAVPPAAESSADQVMFVSLVAKQATLAKVPDMIIEELAATPAASTAPAQPAPRLGSLLGGALVVDLANLKGAVDNFFARLEDLAETMAVSPDTIRLVHWLLAGVTATGAFEFARRKTVAPPGRTSGDQDDPLWAPFPVLAVLPPED